jgi:lysozyme
MMKIGTKGLELIKRFEGCRTEAYLCPANVWTIGYGHTKTAKPGLRITLSQAEALLKQDLIGFEKYVNNAVKVPLNQNQYDALVSFTFNVGTGAFFKSSLLRKLNIGDYSGAANEFPRWVYGGGKKLLGLERRRRAERDLFLS